MSLQKGQVLIFNNAWGIGKIDGIMHARDGKISNVGRWLQRGFMYPNTEEDDKKILNGYARALLERPLRNEDFLIFMDLKRMNF